MTDRRIITPQSRPACHRAIDSAEDGSVLTIGAPPKTREQEAKYHAQLGDISEQYKFCERYWEPEDIKRLCIDQFRRDTIKDPDLADEWKKLKQVEMAPSLDRRGVVALGVQSRKFTKKLASAFVEWLYSFGADNGIVWSDESSKK